MKTTKGSRPTDVSDELRKAKRLEPNRKSGKERHALYGSLPDDEEDEADAYLRSRNRSASALDYLDDSPEGEGEEREDGEYDESEDGEYDEGEDDNFAEDEDAEADDDLEEEDAGGEPGGFDEDEGAGDKDEQGAPGEA